MTVFCDFQILLGCSLDDDHEQVAFFKSLNPRTTLEKTCHHGVGISLAMKNDEIPSFPIEELTALFFTYVKNLANATDCVITVLNFSKR